MRPFLLVALICAAARANPPLNADLLDLAADLDGGKDVAKKVAAFRKKYDDVADLMVAFKPRKNGGIGHGPPRPGDGIEFAIYDLSKKALTRADLGGRQEAVRKVASLTRAMGKLLPLYEPPGLSPLKRAGWREQQAAMEAAAADLAAAARKADPVAVKVAAGRINSACVKCHDACR